jgi:hypothetical protein
MSSGCKSGACSFETDDNVAESMASFSPSRLHFISAQLGAFFLDLRGNEGTVKDFGDFLVEQTNIMPDIGFRFGQIDQLGYYDAIDFVKQYMDIAPPDTDIHIFKNLVLSMLSK